MGNSLNPSFADTSRQTLASLIPTDPVYKNAKKAVVSEIQKRGLSANEFYVQHKVLNGKHIFILEHVSEEVMQKEAAKQNARIVGNPSGKSQECTYSPSHNEVNCLYYQ